MDYEELKKRILQGINSNTPEDRKKEEEKLEYLFNIISGLKDITVMYDEKIDMALSRIETKEITLSGKKGYNKNKSEGFQELGHVWLSGSLKELFNTWNTNKYGDFDSFRILVNMLEDIRTENLMSIRYPQIKNRVINLHIEKINQFLQDFPEYVAENPRAAVYLHAENRFNIPIDIDSSIQDISNKIRDMLEKSGFRDGNWKDMVSVALKISEEIKKWEDEQLKPLQEQLQLAKQIAEQIEKEYKDLIGQESRLFQSEVTVSGDIRTSDADVRNLQQKIDQLISNRSEGIPEINEIINDHTEKLEQLKQYKRKVIDNRKSELQTINDQLTKINKEIDEIYNQKYVPATKEQTDIANEIANKKFEFKEDVQILPKTYVHFFDLIKEKNVGKGSELTKGMIEKLVEEERKKQRKQLEKELAEESDEHPPTDVRVYMPPGSRIKKELPKVKIVKRSERFIDEEHYKIPDLRFALSSGYEIASELKRLLKLKSIVLKKRLYGSLDIKAVKKQLAQYGQLIDPRVLKIKKELVEKHSVLVLTDFSGSMGEKIGQFSKVQYAKQALVTLGKTLECLNVNYSLRGFSATTGRFQICDIVMKDFEEPHIDYTLVNRIFYPAGPDDHCQNRDGSSIRYATKLLSQQRGKKLLIVISDGLPHHPSDRDTYSGVFGEEDTKLAIKEVEDSGIYTIGISIDPSANHFILKVYNNSFIFNDMKKFPMQLTETYIKAIMGKVTLK